MTAYRSRWPLVVCLVAACPWSPLPAAPRTSMSMQDAASGAAVEADADPHASMPFLGGFLRETRILYPLRSGEWQAVGEHRFEDPAYGVSVRYVHGSDEDRWIDLYFYPAGVIDAPDFDKVAQSERASIVAIKGQPGGYDALDMGELRRFALHGPGKADTPRVAMLPGYSVDMRTQREGQSKTSAMTLAFERLYFIKARFSIDEARMSRDTARTLLEAFTAQLVPQLQFVSSGGCWMPLPIEALAADAPTPEGALVTMSADKATPNAFLMQDRVLARDPAAAQAKMLMLLGMSRQGRLFPGCDSAEPTNPEVRDGMREIRLEYHAPPATDAPGDVRPLRRSRSGVG